MNQDGRSNWPCWVSLFILHPSSFILPKMGWVTGSLTARAYESSACLVGQAHAALPQRLGDAVPDDRGRRLDAGQLEDGDDLVAQREADVLLFFFDHERGRGRRGGGALAVERLVA